MMLVYVTLRRVGNSHIICHGSDVEFYTGSIPVPLFLPFWGLGEGNRRLLLGRSTIKRCSFLPQKASY